MGFGVCGSYIIQIINEVTKTFAFKLIKIKNSDAKTKFNFLIYALNVNHSTIISYANMLSQRTHNKKKRLVVVITLA